MPDVGRLSHSCHVVMILSGGDFEAEKDMRHDDNIKAVLLRLDSVINLRHVDPKRMNMTQMLGYE